MSGEQKILYGDTTGVCYNCLNSYHVGCDGNNCLCANRKHEQWWWKTQEEIDEIEFYKKHLYADIEDIRFGIWLGKNGWEQYDGWDRLINIKEGKGVREIAKLFSEYKKENPEP